MKLNRMVASVALAGLLLSSILSGDAFSETTPKRASTPPCCGETLVAKAKLPPLPGGASFKSLLAKAPEDVRMKFLESIEFKNGSLATARIKEIKGSLGKKKYRALLQSVGCTTDHEGYACKDKVCTKSDNYICNTGICAGVGTSVSLGATGLLAGLSESERKKFLNSLDFVDGHFVSAYIADAHKKMSASNFKKLFTALGVKPEEVTSKAKDGLFKVKQSERSPIAEKAPQLR